MKILLVANTAWYLYNFRSALIYEISLRGWEPVLVSPVDRYVGELQKAGFRHIPWDLGRQTVAPWTEMRSIKRLEDIRAGKTRFSPSSHNEGDDLWLAGSPGFRHPCDQFCAWAGVCVLQ